MTSLLENRPGVQSDADAPADVETTPTVDYTAADAAFWAGENTGGCGPDDLSPTDRRIASAMTSLQRFWDLIAGEREAQDAHEAGYAFF